jgi:hypothetical protein
MYIWKLTRQFKDGKLNVRSPLSGNATFEELGNALGTAQWQTRKLKGQGLLRETTRQMIRGDHSNAGLQWKGREHQTKNLEAARPCRV